MKDTIYTYIIKTENENAYKSTPIGKLEKDSNDNLIEYDKSSIFTIINKLLIDNLMKKGIKIDNNESKYIIYRYEYIDKNNIKNFLRIKIDKNYDNTNIITNLNNTILNTNNIIRLNTIKTLSLGSAVILSTEKLKINNNNNQLDNNLNINSESIFDINEQRKSQNLPPLGARYEDGRDFTGSYNEYIKYITVEIDINGNLVEKTIA